MARRKLGQHFLFQDSVLERIAAAACPGPEPLVVEIGAGRGSLTRRLLDHAARVIAMELDRELVAHLEQAFVGEPRLEVLPADVLETPLDSWGPAVIAGNLPYYITSPILERVVRAREAVRRAVFLVQKEVAARITASPGSRDYGFLTVRLQLFFSATALFAVKPGAFRPPPQVDSTVVLLEPRDRSGELGLPDTARFLEFVGHSFAQKRKTIRNNLASLYGRDRVDATPEASARAEQLTLEQFAALYKALVP